MERPPKPCRCKQEKLRRCLRAFLTVLISYCRVESTSCRSWTGKARPSPWWSSLSPNSSSSVGSTVRLVDLSDQMKHFNRVHTMINSKGVKKWKYLVTSCLGSILNQSSKILKNRTFAKLQGNLRQRLNLHFTLFSGAERFYRDIELMIGFRPILYWKVLWSFVTPAVIMVSA